MHLNADVQKTMGDIALVRIKLYYYFDLALKYIILE